MSAVDDCEDPENLADDILDGQDCETVCDICSAEFLDPEDLCIHLTQVHAPELFTLIKCHFCISSLSDLENYALHIRDNHIKSLKMCTYCTKIFIDYDQHKQHERRHFCAKKSHNSCSQCSETFVSIEELIRHEYECHNNDEDGFMLQDIFPILTSILNMKATDFIQSMNNKLSCECTCCGFTSVDIQKYTDHLRMKKCRSLVCDNCSYLFKTKKNLFRHICRHKECFNFVQQTKRKCTECQNLISTRFYRSHNKYCKPIKCLPCDMVFDSMDQLSVHQCKSHPLAIEVKLCKFCSRQCVGAYALRKHMIRVHKHDIHLYKYKCVTCDTPFKHPQKLFAHYFIKHKDLEPYTCRICDKKFRIRKRFTIHIKLEHTSAGFVEFDEKYNVFFSDKKSEKPFVPHCVLAEEELRWYSESPSEGKKTKPAKLDLDLLNQTETEANLTEIEKKPKRKVLKRKHTQKTKSLNEDVLPIESSDEDAPLVALRKPKTKLDRKSIQPLWIWKKKSIKDNRQQLTCKICNKYCYTFQNYQHHMSLHGKNDIKTCIKCSQVFRSKEKLIRHIETQHSSSKLTETLKSLLEKRKKGTVASNTVLTTTQRFQRTIKKSKIDTLNATTAKITPVENGLSVQKFLETFTPEADASKTPNVLIKHSVSIKKVADPFFRKSSIQMTKFVPPEPCDNPKLTLPTKFTPCNNEPVKCTLKVVHNYYKDTQSETQNDTQNDFFTDCFDEGIDKEECIPEVAQEVMLEVSEEPPKPLERPTKIIIPDLPEGLDDISIAHLQPEAPYFKIVKVNQLNAEAEALEDTKKDLIRLPDGTQMITVNPLAHLLGDKNVKDILEPLKKKYYKPKISRNLENLLTKALEKANTPTNSRKRRSTAKKGINIELSNETSET